MFTTTIDRIRLLVRKDKKPYLRLYKILGFYPHNIELYRQALLHKSCSRHLAGYRRVNNERLEFLGDAVLGAVVADILYEHYSKKQEGFLTTLRSKLVRRDTLNKLAIQIGLDKFVEHHGPATSAHNSYMNGNAFEALLGAIYLDRGYKYCYRFMQQQVFKHYIDIEATAEKEENFKSRIIEWCQKHQLEFRFDTEDSVANDGHTPVFTATLFIENILCGTGKGYSKKESQQKAAQTGLSKIRKDSSLVNEIRAAKAQRTTPADTDSSATAEEE